MADVVNEPETPLSGRSAAGLPRNAAQSTAAEPEAIRERRAVQPIGVGQPRPLERLAVIVIAGFWFVQFLYFSIDNVIRSPQFEGWASVGTRAIVSTVGALISFGILKVLRRCTGISFVKRAIFALALAYAGSAIHSIVNWSIFHVVIGPTPWTEHFSLATEAEGYPQLVYLFSWVYLAITVLLLSLTYGEELIGRERRIAELSSEANKARLVSLRYQLNPHFLFNSLNSAASLVSARRNCEAELMLENLADFLRATLKLDADTEIRLRDELQLQSLYLQVEEIRFPHRLRVETQVPEELMEALVPNLITQPLIENCIKHSVAQSTDPVCLAISARAGGGKLEMRIEDSGGNANAGQGGGMGVGLQNVAKRLELHFGSHAGFEAGRTATGFAALISMPLRRAR
jgi:two-component system LytT family sensor kinase